MSRSALVLTSLTVALGWCFVAHAQTEGSATPSNVLDRADALFKEAKQLRDAGRYPEACPLFAESQSLAPAIGVTLYLADCYQRTGRPASARAKFLEALKLAREKNDARADMALARARELEGKLSRMTVAVSSKAPPGSEVRVDGVVIERNSWNVALAVDPVDHVVTLSVPGHAPQTVTAHVASDSPPILVRFDEAWGPGVATHPPLTAESRPPQPPALPSPAVPPTAPAIPAPAAREPTAVEQPKVPAPMAATPPVPAKSTSLTAAEKRRAAEWYLLGVGVAGVAVGGGALEIKNDSMSSGGPNGLPQESKAASVASALGFGIGGAAALTAIVLYLTTPRTQETSFLLGPAPIQRGAGGFLSARF